MRVHWVSQQPNSIIIIVCICPHNTIPNFLFTRRCRIFIRVRAWGTWLVFEGSILSHRIASINPVRVHINSSRKVSSTCQIGLIEFQRSTYSWSLFGISGRILCRTGSRAPISCPAWSQQSFHGCKISMQMLSGVTLSAQFISSAGRGDYFIRNHLTFLGCCGCLLDFFRLPYEAATLATPKKRPSWDWINAHSTIAKCLRRKHRRQWKSGSL